MKKISGVLLAGTVALGIHFYISKSVVANTSNEVNGVISSTSSIGKMGFWLTEVQKKFPNPLNNGELILAITDTEDSIQVLDSPAREKGMALIEKQYKETPNSKIQELQKNLNNLTNEEKIKLNELLFIESQRHLAELLSFLSENIPKKTRECEKPIT